MDDSAEDLTRNVSDAIAELNNAMTSTVLPVTIFIAVETLVGFVGNILILVVYYQYYDRSNFRCFVLSMAVIDLTSCLTTLPGEIFSQMNWYAYEYAWICKVKSFFNVFTAWGSASVLLLLGFDRYRKIRRPLQWQIRPTMAMKLCGVFFILSVIAAFPILFLWGTQPYQIDFKGIHLNVSICEKAEEYAHSFYPLLYIGVVYVFPLGIMICVVIFLNTLTAKSLFGRKKQFLQYRSTIVRTTSNLSSLAATSETEISSTCYSDSSAIETPTPRIASGSAAVRSDLNGEAAGVKAAGKSNKTANNRTDSSNSTEPSKRPRFSVQLSYSNNLSNEIPEPKNLPNNASIRRTSSIGVFVISQEQDGKPMKRNRDARNESVKQKTIIMLVLTIMFVTTMGIYVILTCFVAGKEGVLKNLSNSEKVVFFFFWRLYFINTNINPILYGYMDPRFRAGLIHVVRMRLKPSRKVTIYA